MNGFKGAVFESFMRASDVEEYVNGMSHHASSIPAQTVPSLLNEDQQQASVIEPYTRSLVRQPQGATVDQSDDSSASSQATEVSLGLGTCDCGHPEKDFKAIVRCANLISCKIGEYHKSCVGLANRQVPSGWLFVYCRSSRIRAASLQ